MEKYGKGRLPSLKDKYEEAVEAELAGEVKKEKVVKKVEKKPKRKK